MLSHEENLRLTQVGPGAPMGNFIRRYWIPAAISEEIFEAGGAPARVRLLGENLVVFRGPDGALGLVEEFCPHRGASLAYARNEPDGLRCLYHGWKICGDGRVLETPPEPADSNFAEKLRHLSYPVREAGGIIWTYMGPAELEPPFPTFPWLDLPDDQLLVVKLFQDSNYLQGVEGDLDPSHPNYLHVDFEIDESESWSGAGWQSIVKMMNDGAPEIVCEETPYLMRIGAIRQTADAAERYVRRYEWVAPFYTYIPTGAHESMLFKAWHPIDDFSCFTFYIHYDLNGKLDKEGIYRNWNHRTSPPEFRTEHTLANHHLQNRGMMDRANFSGVEGAAIQDRAVQESMGPVFDRTKEHLGSSDKAVIFYRRLLLRKIKEMEQGKPLPAHDPSLDFDLRSASHILAAIRPWNEVLEEQIAFERQHPHAAE